MSERQRHVDISGAGASETRTVALVTDDSEVRMSAARAFDLAPHHWRLEFHRDTPSDADHVVYGADRPLDLQPRFDPDDPASLLPDVSKTSGGTGSVVAVLAATGGAGATTMAAHLAAASSRCRETVLIEPPGRRSVSLRMKVPHDAAVWEPGEPLAVSVPVAGGSRLIRSGDLIATLEAARAEGRAGVADLDVSPDHLDEILCTGTVSAVVVVVSPARPAALLTRDLLQRLGDIDRIVVSNRVGHGGEMTAGKMAQIIGAPVALEFPCTPALRAAEDAGLLVQQAWNRWWRSVRRLSFALEPAWTP